MAPDDCPECVRRLRAVHATRALPRTADDDAAYRAAYAAYVAHRVTHDGMAESPPSAPPSAPHGDGGGVVRPQGDQLIGAEGASPMKPAPCPKDCPFCLGTNYVATSLRGTTLAAYKADASNSNPCPAGQVGALEAELARMTRLADNHYALVRATSDELTQERERANTAEQFWREYAKSTAIFSARAEAAETEVARLQEALRQLWDENPEITFEEAK